MVSPCCMLPQAVRLLLTSCQVILSPCTLCHDRTVISLLSPHTISPRLVSRLPAADPTVESPGDIIFTLILSLTEWSPVVPWELSAWRSLHKNLMAPFTGLLTLFFDIRRFTLLVLDFFLLLQSTWNNRQLGPDAVYPLPSIRGSLRV